MSRFCSKALSGFLVLLQQKLNIVSQTSHLNTLPSLLTLLQPLASFWPLCSSFNWKTCCCVRACSLLGPSFWNYLPSATHRASSITFLDLHSDIFSLVSLSKILLLLCPSVSNFLLLSIVLLRTYRWRTCLTYFTYVSCLLSVSSTTLSVPRERTFLSASLLYPQRLEQSLAHSRYTITIFWMRE